MSHSRRKHDTDSQGTTAHALAESNRSKVGSGASTPKKRKSHRRSKKRQHLSDPPILQGGKFSGTPALILGENAGKNIESGAEESTSPVLPESTPAAQRRCDREDSELVADDRAIAGQTNADKTDPPHPTPALNNRHQNRGRSGTVTNRDEATRQASVGLANAREQISKLKEEETPALYQTAQERLHIAEVDYHYCLHFPQDQLFRPPPGPRPEPFKKSKYSAIRLERQRIWDLVDTHLREGSLALLEETVSDRRQLRTAGAAQSTADRLMTPDKALTVSATPSSERGLEEATSGDGVMINIYDGIQEDVFSRRPSMVEESGEEGELLPPTSQDDEERPQPEHTTRGASEDENHHLRRVNSGDGDGDAMMSYADSNGFERRIVTPELAQAKSSFQTSVRALSELNPEELKMQLQYFHTGKSLSDVDETLPIKCVACGCGDHEAGKCELLNCRNCGAHKAHLTGLCPVNAKCSKCRESGHDSLSCHYKLKTLAADEIICDLCQQRGHVEEDCELTWRTSGSPWTFDPSLYIVRFSCYECGRSGHLGNDCPSRRPGKSLGTSCWTACQKFSVPARSEEKFALPAGPKRIRGGGEMRIRGKAQSQQRPTLQEKNDEELEFLGSKRIRQTGPPTPIKINSLGNHKVDYGGPRRPPSSIHGQTESNTSRSRLRDNSAHETGSSVPRSLDTFHNATDDSRWRGRRVGGRSRSRSPARRDHGANYGHYTQPASRKIPEANQGVYRPMPGAAQRAWNKHRF